MYNFFGDLFAVNGLISFIYLMGVFYSGIACGLVVNAAISISYIEKNKGFACCPTDFETKWKNNPLSH